MAWPRLIPAGMCPRQRCAINSSCCRWRRERQSLRLGPSRKNTVCFALARGRSTDRRISPPPRCLPRDRVAGSKMSGIVALCPWCTAPESRGKWSKWVKKPPRQSLGGAAAMPPITTKLATRRDGRKVCLTHHCSIWILGILSFCGNDPSLGDIVQARGVRCECEAELFVFSDSVPFLS